MLAPGADVLDLLLVVEPLLRRVLRHMETIAVWNCLWALELHDIKYVRLAHLQTLCEECGRPTYGTKDVLMDRLRAKA